MEPTEVELDDFRIKNNLKSIDVTIFNCVDDLILQAYKYVKETGYKVSEFYDRKSLLTGFKTEDGKYFMGKLMPMKKNKHTLYMQIKNNNITMADFVNTQLIAFL